MSFLGGEVVKNPPANAGDLRDIGSIPGLEDTLEKGMATPWRRAWQPSPGNPMDRGAWWATVHGIAKSPI